MPCLWNDSEMTEKTGFKYSIKFSQSLTSGTIAFEGFYAFDEIKDYDKETLLRLLVSTEKVFQDAGYKVASIVPNNLKQLANVGK
jgi:hypothetical protein